MNKKALISLVLSIVLLTPTVGFAKGNAQNATTKTKQTISEVKKQINQTKKAEKKQQIADFKTEIKAKHATIQQIQQQTIEIKKQIQTKKAQLSSIISDIKTGKKTISADMLAELLSKADDIKNNIAKVKATSEMNKEVTDAQEKINKKDFNNALSSLDKVIAKFQSRLDALKKLNSAMDDALAIANNATVPTTEPVTDTTSTTTGN